MPSTSSPIPTPPSVAKEKVLELARLLTPYCGRHDRARGALHRDPGGDPATTARRSYFTIIMRRFMMRIAEAHGPASTGCGALVTGESLGQVASQTMQAMAVHRRGRAIMPVLRPLHRHGQGGDRPHRPEDRHL